MNSTHDTIDVTKWRNAVDSLASRLADTDSVEYSESEIASDLHSLIDTAVERTHPSWEPGSRCPYCDSPHLALTITFTETVIHYEDGGTKGKGGRDGDRLSWECWQCQSVLQASPLFVLLEWLEDTPETISTLETVLASIAADHDWQGGDECVFCTRTDTRQVLARSVPTTHKNNDYTYDVDVQLAGFLGEYCNGCDEPLQESSAGTLLYHHGSALTL